MKRNRIGLSLLSVTTAVLLPAAAHAGSECRALGANGYIVNWHSMIDQSDPTLKSVVGLGGNLCAPASGAHELAGFDDFPSMPSTSDVLTAGSNDIDVNTFGSVVRKLGDRMWTNGTISLVDTPLVNLDIKSKGTLSWNVATPMKTSMAGSFYSFGSDGAGGTLTTNYWSDYSGLLPPYFNADTLSEPICADVNLMGAHNPGGAEYDYAKTQYLMSYGRFKISQIMTAVPCGDWYTLGLDDWCQVGTGLSTVTMNSGHYVAVVGGFDDGHSKYIGIANPHNELYWSGVSQVTISLAGAISLFDHAGVIYDPDHTSEWNIVTSYDRQRVRHGGTCAAGTALRMAGQYKRGNCR